MGWSATVRYGIDAAPGGLALVQDLLNTAPAGGPREPDLLGRVESAMRWWDEARASWEVAARQSAGDSVLAESDLDGLRTFRDALHVLVTRNNSVDGNASGGALSLPLASVALSVGEDGEVRAEPRGRGWRVIASVVLIEVMEAQRADMWRRLKTCRESLCGAAFYDLSRNNSRVWHDVHICGNAVNVRAYKARKRLAPSHPSSTS